MQDFDQTIATPGKTIQFRKFELRPHLIVLYPQAQFKQIPLETGTVILGRGQDAGIRLDDELVSRKHCSPPNRQDGPENRLQGPERRSF